MKLRPGPFGGYIPPLYVRKDEMEGLQDILDNLELVGENASNFIISAIFEKAERNPNYKAKKKEKKKEKQYFYSISTPQGYVEYTGEEARLKLEEREEKLQQRARNVKSNMRTRNKTPDVMKTSDYDIIEMPSDPEKRAKFEREEKKKREQRHE